MEELLWECNFCEVITTFDESKPIFFINEDEDYAYEFCSVPCLFLFVRNMYWRV